MVRSSPEYAAAVSALARLLATEDGCEISGKYANQAKKIIWPHLTLETQSALVMR